MHKYMRAIGFSSLESNKDGQKIIDDCIQAPSRRVMTTNGKMMFTQYEKNYADGIGVCVCGEQDDDGQFYFDYAYPYIRGTGTSSVEDISVERQAEKESYAGVCDDAKIGVTMIFYLQDIISYVKIKNADLLPVRGTSLTLSALSTEGKILLPLEKNPHQVKDLQKAAIKRQRLVEAARTGDEDAMELLTLDDMDTYNVISDKLQKEDVLSLVDTCFMPYGVECDQYTVLGEIRNVKQLENSMTGEKIFRLRISCNDIEFDLCINEKDVYGDPQAGRRFKGTIWLQGYINYPETKSR